MSRRAAVVVIDACGVGALDDAAAYDDPSDANTLLHVAQAVGGLRVPALERLGLGSILALPGVQPSPAPAVHGRLHPLGAGKDSTTGHWELMGVVAPGPLPTYPRGFPDEVVHELERATGRRFCCNAPASGTEVIEQWGAHHLETGELILYTSVDSVLQLAAHVDVLDEPGLVELCRQVRGVMRGEHAVGRVIARPFVGAPGHFRRTEGRRDLSLAPPGRSYLDELQAAGVEVHGIGKIYDLFAGVGVDHKHAGATNEAALTTTTALLRERSSGLVFTNLIETDQLYGHRHDAAGFARALTRIDVEVGLWLDLLGPDDLLVLTADHGVDPAARHTDHTREYAPLLASHGGVAGHRHDGPLADVGATVLWWLTGREAPALPGAVFLR